MIRQGLGEDINANHVYDAGSLPALMPANVTVGSSSCILNGERPSDTIPANSLVNGFPGGCYVQPPIPDDPWETMSDYQSCSLQLASAKMIEWVYDAEVGRLDALAGLMLGPTYTLTYVPGFGTHPSYYVAVSPEATFVWLDGTVNFQQFALQATYSLIPPQNFGVLSTNSFWYTAATGLHLTLALLGANPTGPIFLSGHSFGAVTVAVLAARYRAANPNRQIRYLTYGMPKVGDARVPALLRLCQGWSMVNTFDVVPTLPADEVMVAALIAFLGAGVLLNWTFWQRGPNQMLMDGAGRITPDTLPLLDFPTAIVVASKVLASLPVPTIVDHFITEYFKRILLRCPNPEWPFTPAEYALILAP